MNTQEELPEIIRELFQSYADASDAKINSIKSIVQILEKKIEQKDNVDKNIDEINHNILLSYSENKNTYKDTISFYKEIIEFLMENFNR